MPSTIVVGGRPCALGIDISRYQPVVDWGAVAACRHFAVLKATGGDGVIYGDGMFTAHARNSAGRLPRGAYHFLGMGNGAAQADAFVRATGGYAGFELPPVVDMETYGDHGQYRPSMADLTAFIDEVHRQVGRRWIGPQGTPVAMIVYTGKPLEPQLYRGIEQFDLWLAAYLNPYYGNPWNGVTNGCVPNVAPLGLPNRFIPSPFAMWNAWQFAGGDGGCPGVGNGDRNCDQNVMTIEMLNRLLGGTTEDDVLNDDDKKWIAELIQSHTGILQPDGPGGTNNLARFHQDDRTFIIDTLRKDIIAAGQASRLFRFMLDPAEGGTGAQFLLVFADQPYLLHVPGDGVNVETSQALVDVGAAASLLQVVSKKRFDALRQTPERPWPQRDPNAVLTPA